MASYTDALRAKGISAVTSLISGDEKSQIAHNSTPFYALSGDMNEDTKFGKAHRLDVEIDGRKRSMYFSPGDHIDDVISAIIEMTEVEPVGPMTLYEYDTVFGSKGYGLEELVVHHEPHIFADEKDGLADGGY